MEAQTTSCYAFYDATNIKNTRYADTVRQIHRQISGCVCTAIICAPSIEWIMERNKHRARKVLEDVINRMLQHWTPITKMKVGIRFMSGNQQTILLLPFPYFWPANTLANRTRITLKHWAA